MFEDRASAAPPFLIPLVALLAVLVSAGVMWPRVVAGTSVERGPAPGATTRGPSVNGASAITVSTPARAAEVTLAGRVVRVTAAADGAPTVIVIAATARPSVTRRVLVPQQTLVSVPYQGYTVAGTAADLFRGQQVKIVASRQPGTGQYQADSIQIAAPPRGSD